MRQIKYFTAKQIRNHPEYVSIINPTIKNHAPPTTDCNAVHYGRSDFHGSWNKRYKNTIWQKSFNYRILNSEKRYNNAINYVKDNWMKHNLSTKYSKHPFAHSGLQCSPLWDINIINHENQ